MKKTLSLILLCLVFATIARAQNAVWGVSSCSAQSFRLDRDGPQNITDSTSSYEYVGVDYAMDVQVSGSIVYAVLLEAGRTAITVTDTGGIFLDSIHLPYVAHGQQLNLFPGGGYGTLLVEDTWGNWLTYILDLQDPLAIDTIALLSYGGPLVISNLAMFMAINTVGLVSFDVSNPIVPRPLDTLSGFNSLVNVKDIDIERGVIYTTGNGNVGVFDVSDPQNLQWLNTWTVPFFGSIRTLDAVDTFLYAGIQDSTPGCIVSKFNVSNPSGPLILVDTLSNPTFQHVNQIRADVRGRIFLSATSNYSSGPFGDMVIAYLISDSVSIQLADTVIIGVATPCFFWERPIALDDTTCSTTSADFYAMISGYTVQVIHQPTAPAAHWTWYFGDGDSSNQLNPSHTYQQAGTYTVCLHAYDNCSPVMQDSCIQIQIGVTGVTPFNDHIYNIYPNPSSGTFKIMFPEDWDQIRV